MNSIFNFAWEFYFGKIQFSSETFFFIPFSAFDELNFNIWSSGLNIWCLNQALVHFVKLQWTLFPAVVVIAFLLLMVFGDHKRRERKFMAVYAQLLAGLARRQADVYPCFVTSDRNEWLNPTLNRNAARSGENFYCRWMCYQVATSGEINCTVRSELKKFHKNRPSIDMSFVIKCWRSSHSIG